MAPSQREYWNAEAGKTWAAENDQLDTLLEPFGRLALNLLDVKPGNRILDIGCGSGAVSRALAAKGAIVTGVDISEPLLDCARAKGGGPTYLLADAGADALGGPYDAAISRFGVMFFEQPTQSFAHLRAVTKPGAPLVFVCWAPLALNDWATAPLAAALPHLKELPPTPEPYAPGPFAFAEEGRALAILKDAGWSEPQATLESLPFVVGRDIDDAMAIMLKIGPLGRLLREQPDAVPAVTGALTTLFQARKAQDTIRFSSAVWTITARS